MASQPADNYPGPRGVTEAERLRAQHRIARHSIGIINVPIELKKPGLRVLDSATADGFWLSEIAPMLSPDAELVGTDIAKFESTIALPSNVKLSLQSIKDPWPEAWAQSFDFVHQRFVLSVITLDEDAAVKAVRQLIELVKPGGWIQLDEGMLPAGPLEESDKPILKLFKYITHIMADWGLDPDPLRKVLGVLRKAGDGLLGPVQVRHASAKIGHGAPTKELEEAGVEQMIGLPNALASAAAKSPSPPITPEEIEMLRTKVMEQIQTEGTVMEYISVWAQRLPA